MVGLVHIWDFSIWVDNKENETNVFKLFIREELKWQIAESKLQR